MAWYYIASYFVALVVGGGLGWGIHRGEVITGLKQALDVREITIKDLQARVTQLEAQVVRLQDRAIDIDAENTRMRERLVTDAAETINLQARIAELVVEKRALEVQYSQCHTLPSCPLRGLVQSTPPP